MVRRDSPLKYKAVLHLCKLDLPFIFYLMTKLRSLDCNSEPVSTGKQRLFRNFGLSIKKLIAFN